MTTATVGEDVDIREIERFLYREARLADAHDYDGWEALWTDDALYWVPVDGAGGDPGGHVSVIYDNRSRIATRILQLKSGRRHAQTPPSRLARTVSNVEVVEVAGEDVVVEAAFVLVESREAGKRVWGGRTTYRLRRVDGELRLVTKKVVLVDNDRPLPTLAFLI